MREVPFRRPHGLLHRVAEGQGVGGAVGLDDGLFDAEELGAADFPVVKEFGEILHAGAAQKIPQLGASIFLEHPLELTSHEHGGALDGLNEHVAAKAVADHNVHLSQRNASALHIAGEVN